MALQSFSRSPLRAFVPIIPAIGSISPGRWNSTAASAAVVSTNPKPRVFHRRRAPNRQKFIEDQKVQGESRILEKFQTRDWKAGDIYAPHDLSPSEMRKWRKRSSPSKDAFDSLNMNPLDLYKNFSIMSEYMTPMGRIKHRSTTGLRPVNQRKIAKAIRRAIGLGLMPSVHRHPEILAAELKSKLD
ncbi:mitochondrial 37S ribosomal protein bS18m [Aspergillus tanneri]|uniref:Small ribosomal subunit protein bS18m n=2 Tax=Aspergillus tanneri TaxID=1220188 RepID=A0A5M9MT15_9EURO|nr:uncharacterized protein ATNIH1004_002678 [Aspergillus tanneri]KAA8649998.1 hypothetical protein ATNIH1004_002678 [Aspergillus tanneri]